MMSCYIILRTGEIKLWIVNITTPNNIDIVQWLIKSIKILLKIFCIDKPYSMSLLVTMTEQVGESMWHTSCILFYVTLPGMSYNDNTLLTETFVKLKLYETIRLTVPCSKKGRGVYLKTLVETIKKFQTFLHSKEPLIGR